MLSGRRISAIAPIKGRSAADKVAQTLATLKALASPSFASQQLGRETAVGDIDPAVLNVDGGSIAIGHPFGATGARLLLHAALTMQRRGVQYGLVSACAAGGQGMALVLERE